MSCGRTVLGALVLVLALQYPAHADGPGDGQVGCDPVAGDCDVHLAKPPTAGGLRPGNPGPVGRRGAGGGPDPKCAKRLLKPQPAKSDPIWNGHKTGSILVGPLCRDGKVVSLVPVWSWSPTGPPEPEITPAELAQRALASVKVPKPRVHRSPSEALRDDGLPYTWVNVWTWFWTDPGPWTNLPAATATLGVASATVTLTPTELMFDPGNGAAVETCRGPGRPWTPADGNASPGHGGCAYRFRSVSEAVSSTVSIRWDVSWTGSGGAGGTLPAMTTQALLPVFKVEQAKVVNR